MHKSDAIQEAVSQLRQRFGTALDVIDENPDDPDAIAVARRGQEDPVVSILAAGKEPGRYDVVYGGVMYPHCVLAGLVWCVQQLLRR
jgi:hypothetical protein